EEVLPAPPKNPAGQRLRVCEGDGQRCLGRQRVRETFEDRRWVGSGLQELVQEHDVVGPECVADRLRQGVTRQLRFVVTKVDREGDLDTWQGVGELAQPSPDDENSRGGVTDAARVTFDDRRDEFTEVGDDVTPIDGAVVLPLRVDVEILASARINWV